MSAFKIIIIGSGGIGRNSEQMAAIKEAGKMLVSSHKIMKERTKKATEAVEKLKNAWAHFDVEAKNHKSKFHK